MTWYELLFSEIKIPDQHDICALYDLSNFVIYSYNTVRLHEDEVV